MESDKSTIELLTNIIKMQQDFIMQLINNSTNQQMTMIPMISQLMLQTIKSGNMIGEEKINSNSSS